MKSKKTRRNTCPKCGKKYVKVGEIIEMGGKYKNVCHQCFLEEAAKAVNIFLEEATKVVNIPDSL